MTLSRFALFYEGDRRQLTEEFGQAHWGRRGTQAKAACRRRNELGRDQLDDKLDYTNRAQGALASASIKELACNCGD
jgi:hypothetical protein